MRDQKLDLYTKVEICASNTFELDVLGYTYYGRKKQNTFPRYSKNENFGGN